ncbi:unnamed protein product [Dovyalis caffra]|uniref:Uncharacterized protein n=1 Tax=Dovyalis caffra TaxID=77055 RepID=A0AAV1SUV5_9ROSI|nr:unnamed protein product [Dovyalis caffra]
MASLTPHALLHYPEPSIRPIGRFSARHLGSHSPLVSSSNIIRGNEGAARHVIQPLNKLSFATMAS